MDWSNEAYARLYVRDTKTWLLLGWEGQCVLCLLLRKLDRAGVLSDVFDGADLAVMLANGMPIEIVTVGLGRLIARNVVEVTKVGLVMPNYLVAQEASKTDQQRKRESRERHRSESRNVTEPSRNVTTSGRNVPFESQVVTGGHKSSQVVTLTSADPMLCSADPDLPPNPPGGGAVLVRDPNRPKPADPLRATFKTQCPDRFDFTDAHRGLAKRGSIDINLEWRGFSKKAQASTRHLTDWGAAFEAHLAECVQRIERAAAYRATDRNAQRGPALAAVASDPGDPATPVAPPVSQARPVANPDGSRKLRSLLGGIG